MGDLFARDLGKGDDFVTLGVTEKNLKLSKSNFLAPFYIFNRLLLWKDKTIYEEKKV